MSEVVSHTVVALVVLCGGFTMMAISVLSGHGIAPDVMTLLTVMMSSVAGWFFGTHSTISGVHAAQSVAAQATTAAESAHAAEQSGD